MAHTQSSGLIDVLLAEGPATELGRELELYGQFVGDWQTDIFAYAPDGSRHQGQGEIHFDWILEGRAIQDVWMLPRRGATRASAPLPVTGNWYGTTVRVYDATLAAWRIFWIDPARNSYRQQIGARVGTDIVQEGTNDDGVLTRWSFTEITAESFHWKAEASMDGGASWRLFVTVLARRVRL